MKYFDKNTIKWQKRQEFKQSNYYSFNYRKKQDLKKFAKNSFIDKEWWRVLSWDEREEVMFSYYDTKETAQMKFKENNDLYFYIGDDIVNIDSKDWVEYIPRWVEYVNRKYPKDISIRRELAIRRILS
jgi:hypothetical protein